MRLFEYLMGLRAPDADGSGNAGGGTPPPSASSEETISLPKAALAERLARAQQKAIADYEARLQAEGRWISSEDAQARAEAEAKAKAEALEAAKSSGRYKEISENALAKLAELEKKYQTETQQLARKLEAQAIDFELTRALSAAPIRKDVSVDDLRGMLLASGGLKYADGQVFAEDDLGQPIPPAKFVENWLAKRAWALAASKPGGTGSASSSTGGANGLPAGWNTDESIYRKLSPEQRQQAMAELRKPTDGGGFGFQRRHPPATKKD